MATARGYATYRKYILQVVAKLMGYHSNIKFICIRIGFAQYINFTFCCGSGDTAADCRGTAESKKGFAS